MDLDLSRDQLALREAVRDLLAEYRESDPVPVSGSKARDLDVFGALAARGWLGDGGCRGIGAVGMALVFEELGRFACPGPFLGSAVESAGVLAELGLTFDAEAISRGRRRAAYCLREHVGEASLASVELVADVSGDVAVARGAKAFVPHAADVDEFVVVARTPDGEHALLRVDARSPEIVLEPLDTLYDDGRCDVVFDAARALGGGIIGPPEAVRAAVEGVGDIASIARCAEILGDAESALGIAVEYAGRREQFGQPIGAYQALQHQAADRKVDVDACRLAIWEAAARIDAGIPHSGAVASAALLCSEAGPRVTATAHQIHGAAGFYADSRLARHTRRVQQAVLQLGSPTLLLDRVAAAVD